MQEGTMESKAPADESCDEVDCHVATHDENTVTTNGAIINDLAYGIAACFGSIVSIFDKTELKQRKVDDWEVPYESLKYLVCIGSGAHGLVYSGLLRGETVAVKKLQDKREIDLMKHLRKLSHDNIVQFKGVCSKYPDYCVIMEYCKNGHLHGLLNDPTFTCSSHQLVEWAKEIAGGMAYLHSNKIIHRDLKSLNILLNDNCVAKISDFGTSKEWNEISQIMSFNGTLPWMAPECITGKPVSDKVDVWSYGVVMWELLTQQTPYQKYPAEMVILGVGTERLHLPIPSSVPECLKTLIQQCWSNAPRNRPSFKLILNLLEIVEADLLQVSNEEFRAAQEARRLEIQLHYGIDKSVTDPISSEEADLVKKREKELNQVRDIRRVYRCKLEETDKLYMEVTSVLLKVKERERAVDEREKYMALREWQLEGFSRKSNQPKGQSSSSPDERDSSFSNLTNIFEGRKRCVKLNETRAEKVHKKKSHCSSEVRIYKSKDNKDLKSVTIEVNADDIESNWKNSIDNNNMVAARRAIAFLQIQDQDNGNVEDSDDIISQLKE